MNVYNHLSKYEYIMKYEKSNLDYLIENQMKRICHLPKLFYQETIKM